MSSLKLGQIMSSSVDLGQGNGRCCMGNPGRHSHCQRAVSPLEGQVRADLIRGDLLPKAVKSALHLQGIDTVLGILKIIFREYMPSESTCRLETLQALERPVKAGRNYKECLTSPSALQLRPAGFGSGVGSNPGLLEDVSKSSGFADKRAQRRPPFRF